MRTDWLDRLIHVAFVIVTVLVVSGIFKSTHTAPRKPVVGIHYFTGVVDSNTYLGFKKAIRSAEKAGLDTLKVYINSPGGWLDTAESVMRLMQRSDLKFKCIVNRMAASAAFLIFVNCDERIMVKKGVLIWHQIKTSIPVPVDSYLLDYYSEEMKEAMLFYARMIAMYTDYTVEEIQHNIRYFDWYIFQKEALERGLVHKVIK